MGQEDREPVEDNADEHRSILEQIEAGWPEQTRRPTAEEVAAWIEAGRE